MSFTLQNLHQIAGNEDILKDHINRYIPIVIRNPELFSKSHLFSSLLSSNEEVDISCIDKDSSRFNGNSSVREKVKIKLNAFAECFSAHMRGEHHWLDDAELNLYLSQFPLLLTPNRANSSYKTQQTSSMIPLPDEILRLGLEIKHMNLWMNINDAVTNFHYDAYNNFLYIIEGSKEVLLLPPNNPESLTVAPAYETSCNHSAEFLDSAHSSKTKCKLQAGDMLYIPEGWWHSVISDPCTIAVNIWFESSFQTFISSAMDQTSHMQSYYLRRLSEIVLESKLKSTYHSLTQSLLTYEDFQSEMLRYYSELFGDSHSVQANSTSNEYPRKRVKIEYCMDKQTIENKLFCSLSMDAMMKLYPIFAKNVRSFFVHVTSPLMNYLFAVSGYMVQYSSKPQ